MSARLLATCLAVIVLGAAAAPAPAAPGLSLGFNDDTLVFEANDAALAEAFPRAKQAGGEFVRFAVIWRTVARSVPAAIADTRNPAWPGYDWTRVDATVRAAAAAGLSPVLYVRLAPDWAEGPDRPPLGPLQRAGTWKPSPEALGALAQALATRYSGRYADPLNPAATLPRVPWLQAFNEPNLYSDLTPQWERRDRRFVPFSPGHYRRMANAFYAGVKAGDPTIRVLSAGTGPFGDLNEGDPRMPPLRFWRELLCIRDGAVPKTTRCGQSVRFDAIAHHPYPIGPPRRTARNADDAVVPDVRKIIRLLPAALRGGTLRPRTATKPVWVTEISWDSAPDPDGLSLAEHGTYLQAALYVLWRQGVSTVLWWQLRDQAPQPSFAATFQSGIFLRGSSPAADVPKPAYTAFRFPFTAYRTGGVARLWGKAPARGAVTIQAQQGARWVNAARLRAGGNLIFSGRLRVGPKTRLRAVSGEQTSLAWVTQ